MHAQPLKHATINFGQFKEDSSILARKRAGLSRRAEDAIVRGGPAIAPQALKTFARGQRQAHANQERGYRHDHLRALAQRIQVDTEEPRIMRSKSVLQVRSSQLQAQKR